MADDKDSSSTGPMKNIEAASPQQFRAVVFKRAPATSDFTCSEPITLPGRHTAAEAWNAVHAMMRTSAEYLGGEIRACAPLSAH